MQDVTIRIHQLPMSVTRWQHGFQICFVTYLMKNNKIANNSTNTKVREKISTDLDIFVKVWLNLKTIIFYLIKLATDF
jgi:hypothetical protein